MASKCCTWLGDFSSNGKTLGTEAPTLKSAGAPANCSYPCLTQKNSPTSNFSTMLACCDSAMADADPWDAVLSFGELSMSSLIRISCINRSLRRLCEQRAAVGSVAPALLVQAVSAAAAAAQQPAQQPAQQSHIACWQQQLAWILKQAPDVVQDSSAMSAIMHVHHVPPAAAEVLLRAGARFTWQQLQEAATSLVPGLQVWATVSRELQLQMDPSVPRIAAAICCGVELDLKVRITLCCSAAACLLACV